MPRQAANPQPLKSSIGLHRDRTAAKSSRPAQNEFSKKAELMNPGKHRVRNGSVDLVSAGIALQGGHNV